jgi:hypothetical protein
MHRGPSWPHWGCCSGVFDGRRPAPLRMFFAPRGRRPVVTKRAVTIGGSSADSGVITVGRAPYHSLGGSRSLRHAPCRFARRRLSRVTPCLKAVAGVDTAVAGQTDRWAVGLVARRGLALAPRTAEGRMRKARGRAGPPRARADISSRQPPDMRHVWRVMVARDPVAVMGSCASSRARVGGAGPAACARTARSAARASARADGAASASARPGREAARPA